MERPNVTTPDIDRCAAVSELPEAETHWLYNEYRDGTDPYVLRSDYDALRALLSAGAPAAQPAASDEVRQEADWQAVLSAPTKHDCSFCGGKGFYGIPGQRCRFCDGKGHCFYPTSDSPAASGSERGDAEKGGQRG